MPVPSAYSQLPSVDRILREIAPFDLPRPVVLAIARAVLSEIRAAGTTDGSADDTIKRVRSAVKAHGRRQIQPVINATGIIVHTNLGRAPLGPAVARALTDVATRYSTVEYDPQSGQRGSRAAYLENALAVLCQAEAATVVNNCAAALVLILRCFIANAPRNQVVISRGELIQIGGGFRIPEILQASGAVLHEIGATNTTTLDDYRKAFNSNTALVLKIHRSNFYMDGFSESPPSAAIARLTHEAHLPFVEDLGSGAMFDTATLGGGEEEPIAAKALADGADIVCFSGDKLFGGPQAGIIAGAKNHIAALKAEPFFRALRCDKLVLTALQATVDHTLSGNLTEIPIRAMMSAAIDPLRQRAARAADAMRAAGLLAEVVDSQAQVGGGSLPRTRLDSVAISLAPRAGRSADDFAAALRRATPPIIAYVFRDHVRMDLRTIFPEQDDQWIAATLSAASTLR